MKIKNILLGILILVLMSPNINAFGFGVTQPETVVIPVGESKVVDFSVQSGAGDTQDLIATLAVLDGEEIVEIIESNEYFIPASGKTNAKIKINIPNSAKPTDEWNVKLAFKARPAEQVAPTGMVSLGQGVEINFKVKASEPVKEVIPTARVVKVSNYKGALGIVIVLIALVVFFLLTRKKKGKKRK